MSALRLALCVTLAIALRVSPLISFAPATVTIQVRVHPEPSDRQIVVQLDSGEFGRRSEFTIDGDKGPRLYSWTLRDLPPGQYEVVAQIGDWTHARASDHARVEIR